MSTSGETALVSPPPNEEGLPRRNGWSCPWHPFTGIAWFFILFFALAYFGFLVFYVPGLFRIIAIVIPGLILITHVVATVVTMTIDPAEPEVRRKRSKPNWFDRSAHEHVIENYYCNICQVNVSENAKHCRICNKCVVNFDHHCLWLNTCIGSRNYRWFLVTLFSALLAALLLFLYCFAFFVLYFRDRDSVRFNCPNWTNLTACDPTLRVLGGKIPDVVFPIFLAVLAALALIAIGLVGHLTGYHIYLMIKGISTYDHIRLQREAEQLASAERTSQPRRGIREILRGVFRKKERKSCRVTPTTDEDSLCSGSPRGSPRGNRRQRRSRSSSDNGSLGMSNFGRTPPSSRSSSTSGSGPHNLTDEQKLSIEATPLVSILKPPSSSFTPHPLTRKESVVEVELTALATIAASPAPAQRYDETEGKGSPELPFHLQSGPSPPPSPTRSAGRSRSPSPTAPKRVIQITKEDYECGTLNFLAGGHEDEEEWEAPKKTVESKVTPLPREKPSTVVAGEDDPMDCSTLVAMAVMNSVDEEDEYSTVGKSPKSSPVKTIDRATSPTLPAHLVLPQEITNANANANANANNSNAAVESKEEIEAKKKEEEKEAHARLHAQYRRILQDKRLKRTGSLGSNDSRLSLSSSLSLIPESVPTSRRVGDKLSNEFPLTQSSVTAVGGASANEEPAKRVSFQDQSPSPSPVPTGEIRPIGRPLPSRLLPPIGTDTSVYGMDPLVSPRSGSRPLPPLAGMGTGHSKSYDTLSLQSAGSSTQVLYKTGSTNSLPTPDPRYSTSNVRGGHMQKVGGARRKTPPPQAAMSYGLKPLPSIGISNVGEGASPRQDQ